MPSPRRAFFARCLIGLEITGAVATLFGSDAMAAGSDKTLRLVVPFAPGGGTDALARGLGAGMSKALDQTVIIDNRPGAGTVIGSEAVARAPKDGSTLLVATFAHAVNPSLQPRLPYSTDEAFAAVALIGRGPNVLVVRAESPYQTVQELIAAARAEPRKLTYASQGNGTSAHLAGEMFTNLARVQMTHIPYRGAAPALNDLLGGQVTAMFATAAAATPLVAGGKLRALGVTSVARSAGFRNVPAIGEIVPGYAVESWYGLYAPAGTPPEVITRLNLAAAKAARDPAFSKQVEQEGLVISAGPPAELDAYVHAEEARWRRIVAENHIKID